MRSVLSDSLEKSAATSAWCEEELHGPLYFLWRHRSKFHEKTVPFSAWSHYAIVSRASNAPGSRPA